MYKERRVHVTWPVLEVRVRKRFQVCFTSWPPKGSRLYGRCHMKSSQDWYHESRNINCFTVSQCIKKWSFSTWSKWMSTRKSIWEHMKEHMNEQISINQTNRWTTCWKQESKGMDWNDIGKRECLRRHYILMDCFNIPLFSCFFLRQNKVYFKQLNLYFLHPMVSQYKSLR